MLATAKAAGPRHGDTSVAPQRRMDSLVDDLDTAVGLPRYLGIQTTLENGSRDGPPVQRKCAACEAEDEDEASVQLWDCSEYQEPTCVQTQDAGLPPVQAKCAACEEEEEKKVQLCDCSEHEELTRVQTEAAGLPPLQAKCAACEEAEAKEEEKASVTQRQVQLWDCSEYRRADLCPDAGGGRAAGAGEMRRLREGGRRRSSPAQGGARCPHSADDSPGGTHRPGRREQPAAAR